MPLARFHFGGKNAHIRPQFTVRSLMIVVVVASLVSALVAYELRLKGWARYYEARYFEHIIPLSSPAPASAQGRMYRSKLVDGTWSAPHYQTPQAEWYEQQKWKYLMIISGTNFFVVAALAGSAFLWLVCKAVLTMFRRDREANQ